MNLDLTRELDPVDANDTEFKILKPLPEWSLDASFDRSLNSYGVVYVRLLCAKRLSCPVGSSVVGAASLPPFAGRVKTHRTAAFLSSFEHGVCVKWDPSTQAGYCSMVNSWNSEDSPIPSIHISLMFSPLGMGLLDFTMCTLLLTCEVLMTAPGVWKTQWCQARIPDSTSEDGGSVDNRVPLIKLQAMFEPRAIETQAQPWSWLGSTKNVNDLADMNKISSRENGAYTAGGSGEVKEGVAISSRIDQTDSPKATRGVDAEDATATKDSASCHMLRVASYWVPSSCAVCSALLVGKNSGFHCEECSITCCSDCRLCVDLKIPCGSTQARDFVERSIHNKMSVKNFLSIVAPDEAFSGLNQGDIQNKLDGVNKPVTSQNHDRRLGIGRLKVEFVKARLFKEPLIPDESPENSFGANQATREGEFYARITSSVNVTKTARTRPIYAGSPHFNSKEFHFDVAHYGEEFRLDCVDASTDEVIGSAIFSTHGMLQYQRDGVISATGASLFQFLRGPIVEKGKRTMKLLLRQGFKDAFGLASFTSSRALDEGNQKIAISTKGAISGWLKVNVGLEEYTDMLYHPMDPAECPAIPAAEFDMGIFQNHIQRVKGVLDDIASLVDSYTYLVSWKDPLITGLAMAFLVMLCLRFNAESFGSLPISFLLIFLIRCSIRQGQVGRKASFIGKETKDCRKAGKASVSYTMYRPFGRVVVSVSRGSALVSRDLGLPGQASCHVYFDPLRFASADRRSEILKYDLAADSIHDIGSTKPILSAEPNWNEEHYHSLENRRLNQLLRQGGGIFVKSMSPCPELVFPVLQLLEVSSRRRDSSGRFVDGKLKNWNESPGAVVLQVRLGLGFDQNAGEVVFPLAQLVARKEVEGWFQLLQPGTRHTVPIGRGDKDLDAPRVLLKIKWISPEENSDLGEKYQEMSLAIQEEMIRSSQLSKQKQFDLVETSIGAMNTAFGLTGNVQFVQNKLGNILDYVECIQNLLNFTDPFKSSFIFFVLSLVWAVFVVIPTRYLVLVAVMAQFASTFIARFGTAKTKILPNESPTVGDQSSSPIEASKIRFEPANFPVWLKNAVRSLPTNEDLRRAYFWESRRVGFLEKQKISSEKRILRLNRLWKAQWYSSIEIRMDRIFAKALDKTAYAVIEGRRFLWWESVSSFDSGELPMGCISLLGHSGLTNPSPTEVKDLPQEGIENAVTVFGKGLAGQQRIAFVLPDSAQKEKLEATVSLVSGKND